MASGWNVWVWLSGGGCGWNLLVWLVGVFLIYIYIQRVVLNSGMWRDQSDRLVCCTAVSQRSGGELKLCFISSRMRTFQYDIAYRSTY